MSGAREPWRQSRRGSHKISPNGAKIGLGSHKFSEVIENTAVTISRRLVDIFFNRLLLYCLEIHFDDFSFANLSIHNSLTRA